MWSWLVWGLLLGFPAVTWEVDADPQEAAAVADDEPSPAATGEEPQPEDSSAQNLQDMLAKVEKNYGDVAKSLRLLQKKIESNRRNIARVELEILTAQQAIAAERRELSGHVKSAYQIGRQEGLKLFLNQQDPASSARMMLYYRAINKARMAKIVQLDDAIKALERLDEQKRSETSALEQNQKQKKSQQAVLEEIRKERKRYLAYTEASSYEEQLRNFTESEAKIRSLVASLAGDLDFSATSPSSDAGQEAGADAPPTAEFLGDFSGLKGKLLWPVQGRRLKNVAELPGAGQGQAVLIEAKEGNDVHAVAAGKVVFAEWLRGYGYLLILDHGEGYMTLYGFNQTLYKAVNEWVKPGEVVGAVGQSGGRSQPGLYFGIRKQAVAMDPWQWCRND